MTTPVSTNEQSMRSELDVLLDKVADPTLRAAEALVAAADAWDRERAASGRMSAVRDDVERRKAVMEREEAAGQALIKRIPQRRLGELRELEGPLLLLASEAGSYMTGSVIVADGGHVVSTL